MPIHGTMVVMYDLSLTSWGQYTTEFMHYLKKESLVPADVWALYAVSP